MNSCVFSRNYKKKISLEYNKFVKWINIGSCNSYVYLSHSIILIVNHYFLKKQKYGYDTCTPIDKYLLDYQGQKRSPFLQR